MINENLEVWWNGQGRKSGATESNDKSKSDLFEGSLIVGEIVGVFFEEL
jgi:hypothetical protein